MSINSIPLFFDESSISKRINMTSVFEENAASNAQNCTWYQRFSSKYQTSVHIDWTVLDCSSDLSRRYFDQVSYYWFFFKMQKNTNSTIFKLNDGTRNLNANFKRLESDVQVYKKLNDVLVKQLASL